MKNRVFSQHEKHPNRMVYAANLSIEGGQEPIKMEAEKLENYRKMKQAKKQKKYENGRGWRIVGERPAACAMTLQDKNKNI